MRYITVSIDKTRVAKQRKIWHDLEVFPGVTGCEPIPADYRLYCIPEAYRNLAQWAVSEGLGRESIVMQDDVWLPHGPGFDKWQAQYSEPLVVFGLTESTGIVVPKAFSATPEIWLLLADVWDGTGRVGPAWMPVVEQYGAVLDVTREMGG